MSHTRQDHHILSPDFLKTIPNSPGVYLMINKVGKVIYAGKALDLRKRLASYARFQGAAHSKTGVMVSRIARVETILTRTEKEALILESSLIKEHRPKYNVILRDDKNYPLIKVTVGETWPRVMMTRRKIKDKSRYFGPFSSVGAMWSTIKLLQSLFPLRRCKGAELEKRSRPCLNFQMKRCPAPCMGKVDAALYQEMVRDVLMVLEGRNRELAHKLKEKMSLAVSRLQFEEAALYRDQLRALAETLEKQIVAGEGALELDVFGFVRQGPSVAISIMTVRHGRVLGQQVFFLAEPVGEDAEVLAESVKRYYEEADFIPRELLFPLLPDDHQLLSEWLSERKKQKVIFKVPVRGDKTRLLDMAQANAGQVFAEKDKKEKSWDVLAASLMETLHLQRRPDRIECLDISNISGQQAVGSLVCFEKGEKSGKRYRHYKIKTVPGPDDYRMIAEVLERRFTRGIDEGDLPDLLMLDGGKGQLHVGIDMARRFALQDRIELVGIAKGKGQEGEKLFRPGRKNPILLPRHSSLLLFLMRIRDESHRYGITFHRKLRHKSAFSSEIDKIPGVGPMRKKKLLQVFGSLTKLKDASTVELAAVSGIGPDLADVIARFFREDG
ncbi:MAG: excinuclease ABC subunit UvrC [Proteobacteria bacterium]|nr:excinuclease ABC subunit UvrC [Pseudomonadota bacterium]MBU4295650.1 excinuclease ABC subunit UvrC [Pseudomonadota bacterium]